MEGMRKQGSSVWESGQEVQNDHCLRLVLPYMVPSRDYGATTI